MDSFAVALDGVPPHRAEWWARAVYTVLPHGVGLLLRVGFRYVLGVPLGPSCSLSHLTDCLMSEPTGDSVEIGLRSRLIESTVEVVRGDSELRLTTTVRFRGRRGALLWRLVRPVHTAVVPYLLDRAVERGRRAAVGDPGPGHRTATTSPVRGVRWGAGRTAHLRVVTDRGRRR